MYRRAFTLIELLVVISIIALLSSVVMASLNSARDKGRLAAGKQFAANVDHAESDYAVGMWDFTECSGSSATDRTGNNGVATISGGPAWSTDTPTGTGCSLLFNGTAQSVTGAKSVSDLISSSFTISAWAKHTTTGGNNFIFSLGTVVGTNTLFHFGFRSSNVFTCAFYANDLDTTGTYTDSNWHQWTCVYDMSANKRTIYLDGAVVGSNAPGASFQGSGPPVIGAVNGGSYFVGNIDNVHLFAKALTAEEVGKMYAESAPRHVAER